MKKKGKILIFIMSSLSAWYATTFVRSFLPSFHKYSIEVLYDPLFSEQYQQKISSIVNEYQRITLPHAFLLKVLKDSLPLVKEISLVKYSNNYIKHNRVKIKTIAYKPLVKVNEDRLLLENGICIKKSYFNPFLIDSLYQIEVKKNDHVLHSFASKYNSFRKHLALDIFDHYSLNWQDD